MPFQTSGAIPASRVSATLPKRAVVTRAQSGKPLAAIGARPVNCPPKTSFASPQQHGRKTGSTTCAALSWIPDAWEGLAGMKEYSQNIADGKDVTKPFGQERWAKHQNMWRFLRHILDLVDSRILKRIAGPLLWVAFVAVSACTLQTFAPAEVTKYFVMPMVTFTITSAILGLLLVFRTNASYGRWDEARKMWGLMVNRTRDMNRQYAVFFPKDAARAEKRAFMQRWTVAFVYSLKCHLREAGDLKGHLESVLPPHELQALLDSKHRPLYTLQCLAAGISGSGASDILKSKMDENLTAMEDCVGGCERLLRTPIPLSYTRHTTRFLIIWLTLLPFGLFPTCGWATIFVSLCVAASMLGVEEIGVGIEEPFKILALDALCATIAANSMDILKDGQNSEHSANRLFNQALTGSPAYVAPVDGLEKSLDEADSDLQSMSEAVQRLESALGQASTAASTAGTGGIVSPVEAMAIMKDLGAVQVDVRPANVFARDCYTKAVNVPFVKVSGFGNSAVVTPVADFLQGAKEIVPISTPIVVCGGEHTEGAAEQLRQCGYMAYEIEGGFAAWTKVYNPKGELRQKSSQATSAY